jgi:dihydroflavonol-4-reductase
VSTVLVTGGSGFIGSHAILQLLAAGHQVCTTVRSLVRETAVRTMLRTGGADPGDSLAFFATDLTADAGWSAAVAGCDFVLHVASPFPAGAPRSDAELIVPARDGTLRVLRAARDAGVRRVVLTSSFAAIGYGHANLGRPFNETDWTDPARAASAYVKSKTIAERAAWDFIAREGGGMELAVINPVAVMGPVLGPDYSSSIALIQQLLRGALPGLPQLWFGIVDVRDVARGRARCPRVSFPTGCCVSSRCPARACVRFSRNSASRRMAATTRRSGCSAGRRVRPKRPSSPRQRACCASSEGTP